MQTYVKVILIVGGILLFLFLLLINYAYEKENSEEKQVEKFFQNKNNPDTFIYRKTDGSAVIYSRSNYEKGKTEVVVEGQNQVQQELEKLRKENQELKQQQFNNNIQNITPSTSQYQYLIQKQQEEISELRREIQEQKQQQSNNQYNGNSHYYSKYQYPQN